MPEWKIHRVGWSPDNPQSINQIIIELCDLMHFKGAQNMEKWCSPNDKDGGLDIVCYRSFPDKRVAFPMYFLQCASGKNWKEKVYTPNPEYWQKILDSILKPSKGVAIPFIISNEEFENAALNGQIVIFDRYRLLRVTTCKRVKLSDDLKNRLLEWVQPKIENLPLVY
ncbi:MAG: hypothetical protein OXH65_01475 [Paracoccaceae bacterium]|nr:hypothetical protein [Paracoccaceae bacterium]